MLYWFRTPPGVKVGRTALDDDALRRIEQQNPDLEFDWPRILKGGGAPPAEPRPAVDLRRPDRSARSGVRPQSRNAPPSQSNWGPTPTQPPAAPQVAVQSPDQPPAPEEWGQTPVQPAGAAQNERGLTPFEGLPADGTPAHERLGQDGVQRLRQRYADVRARILERADPAGRDELMATAARLNPDAWTTADEVTGALEQYEAVLASLREVVGRKRRRRKRGGRRGDNGSEAPAAAGQADPAGDGAEAQKDDEDDDGGEEPGNPGSGDQGPPV